MDPTILRLLAAASRVSSLALHASVAVENPQITIPASAKPGDVAVLIDAAADLGGAFGDNAVLPTYVLPSGWTLIDNQSTAEDLAAIRSVISYRILLAGDEGTTITGMDISAAGGGSRKVMLVFRADGMVSGVTVGPVNSEGTTGNPTSQTVSASGVSEPVVVVAAYRSAGGALSSLTFSPTQGGEVTNGTGMSVRYRFGASDVTVDMPDCYAQTLQSFYLRVS